MGGVVCWKKMQGGSQYKGGCCIMSYGYGDADRYVNKKLICWASYPDDPMARAFSLHPVYALVNGQYERVDEASFPDDGAFTAMPSNRWATAPMAEMEERYGHVVMATVSASFKSNASYGTAGVTDQLLAFFDPDLHSSHVSIERLAESSAARDLYQVFKVPESAKIDFSRPLKAPIRLSVDAGELCCPHIFLQERTADGPAYFGPFSYQLNQQGCLRLTALEHLDYRVYRFMSIPGSERIALNRDAEGGHAQIASFLQRGYIDALIDKAGEDDSFDWLPEERMGELFRSIINGSEKMKAFDKPTLNSLKSAIHDYCHSASTAGLDAQRRKRLEDAVDGMEDAILFNKEVLNQILTRIDDERLGRAMARDDVYPAVKDRLLKSASIKERLDEERYKLEREMEDVRTRRNTLLKEEADAKEACSRAREEESQARANAEKTIADALAKRRGEIEQLDACITEREASIKDAQDRYERAVHSKLAVEEQIDRILANLNNEATATGKILENEILRKVVRAVNDLELDERQEGASAPLLVPVRGDADSMTPGELVEEISKRITKMGGRSVSRNEAVNMVTCLMQGYITTFAGTPGTGKTSMCRILAGALGLTSNNPDLSRFTEIDVENGWTSYKDYIGYHNPIAKTYEKTIPQVFDAMKRLSAERAGEGDIAPYLFLLDEANLSPIEHYWGPFMHACDTFRTCGGKLALGREEDWRLPGHMRFLATVNYDHTTEALSPRFLDRSWVITLKAPNSMDELGSLDVDDAFDQVIPYSYGQLLKVFGGTGTEFEDDALDMLFSTLANVCKDNGMPISHRSLLMMRRYISAAAPLMSADEVSGAYAPLDYAFAQKVLPSIAGPREVVGTLVDELLRESQSLKVTTSLLENIKKHGEDSGYYQYFI